MYSWHKCHVFWRGFFEEEGRNFCTHYHHHHHHKRSVSTFNFSYMTRVTKRNLYGCAKLLTLYPTYCISLPVFNPLQVILNLQPGKPHSKQKKAIRSPEPCTSWIPTHRLPSTPPFYQPCTWPCSSWSTTCHLLEILNSLSNSIVHDVCLFAVCLQF